MAALTEAYRHIGARLRTDIEKNRGRLSSTFPLMALTDKGLSTDAPAGKLPALLERFEAVRASGSV